MLRQNMANRVKLTKTDSFVAVLRGAFNVTFQPYCYLATLLYPSNLTFI